MKTLFKAALILVATLAVCTDTNSCAVMKEQCERKTEIIPISKAKEVLEINTWTMVNKFNF